MVAGTISYTGNVCLSYYTCGHGPKNLSRTYQASGCIGGEVGTSEFEEELPATLTIAEAQIRACEWFETDCGQNKLHGEIPHARLDHFIHTNLVELPLGLCEECRNKKD